ncbi:MAG: dipeptide ABC transporter ATP-binding protein [Anaerolineales bacterium]|nr:dipeptide ABC transporter ATP-binding protein [Anaerolineales bacterium]
MQQPVQEPVLKVEDLEVTYTTRAGPVKAVRDVSFEIWPGDALGLVGESGCGKSTLALAIMNYVAKNAAVTCGRILFFGENICEKSGRELDHIRGNKIAMVYQDPMAALNPSLRIGRQLTEVLEEHKMSRGIEAMAECIRMLERVRMPDPPAIMERYPHQLSGGQQQRVLIAMALLANPALLILDEPTTGLDVTVEAGILDLIAELKHEFDSTILYISHNLGVVSRVADRVAVMYAGELVEQGSVQDIFLGHQHPYTVALFGCIPKMSASRQIKILQPIRGKVPSLHETPSGCVFEPRCDRARERCRIEHPDIVRTADGHLARCFYADSPDPAEVKTLRAELAEADPSPRGEDLILEIEGLKTYYKAQERGLVGLTGRRKKGFVKAVDDVNLMAWKKSTLGIVGESGCGKTTLAKCVAGLVPPNAGKMDFIGIDVARVVEQRPFELLKELQMIFQNPDSTLNPRRSVGEAIARPLRLFGTVPSSEIMDEVLRLLEAVRLGEDYCDRLPRQLSGGERQRVALARAFAGRPTLVLCDEPLSSLDVSVQAAVLNLLLEFQQEYGTTMLFISHDLSVVFQLCDNVAVMYLGQFCEIGPTEALFAPPYHPYTEALLSAVPIPDPTVERTSIRLSGTVPSALDPPSGCRFHTRCPRKIGPICERESPPWRGIAEGHQIYCHIEIEELQDVEPVFSTAQ